MTRKFALKWAPLLAAIFVLAACGGDSGSETPTPVPSPIPTSVPSPSPSPTPVPTPTPASTPLTTLPVPVTVVSGTPVPISTAQPANGTVFPGDCLGPDAITTDSFATVEGYQTTRFSDVLRYSQSEKRYTYIDQNPATNGGFGEQLDLSLSFGPGDVLANRSNQQQTVFQRSCSGFPERKVSYTSTLTLFNPGSANPALVLNYASYGSLQFTTVTAVGQSDLYRPFGYGLATTAAGLNRTGVVTYRGQLEGVNRNDTGPNNIFGTFILTVDFTHKSFTMVVDFTGTPVGGTAPVSLGSITFEQSGGADLSKLVGSASGGNLAGFFAGPAAEEAAITLKLESSVLKLGSQTINFSGAAKR